MRDNINKATAKLTEQYKAVVDYRAMNGESKSTIIKKLSDEISSFFYGQIFVYGRALEYFTDCDEIGKDEIECVIVNTVIEIKEYIKK